jgi:hypothetical protein
MTTVHEQEIEVLKAQKELLAARRVRLLEELGDRSSVGRPCGNGYEDAGTEADIDARLRTIKWIRREERVVARELRALW